MLATMPPPPSTPGIDVPDHRGRTGLDRTGRDLDRNPHVRVVDVELLAAAWHVLRRTTLEYTDAAGTTSTQQRETYDRGNGATVLLYDPERRTVLLTRQFRYPVYVNDHPDGMLVETAAGLLDDDDPVTAIRREAAEETGARDRRGRARVRRVHEPGIGDRAHALLRRAVRRLGARARSRRPARRGRRHRARSSSASTRRSRWIRDGRIQDAKTIMLLQWAVLDGPFAPLR